MWPPSTDAPRPPRRSARGPRTPRQPSVLLRSAPLLLAGLLAACAANPSANIRESWQSTETGDTSTTSTTSLLEVGVQDNLGPDLQFRATDRLIQTDIDLSAPGGDSSDSRLLHQPSLDLILTAGAFRWTQGLELQQNRTDPSPGTKNTLERTDVLQKIEWSPIDLPKVTAWLDDRTDKDDLFVDQRDTETVLQIEDARGPVSWLYTMEGEQFTDNSTDLQRDRTEHIARASYRDDFLDQRLTTSVNLFSDDRRTVTTLPSGSTGSLPVGEIFPSAGLAVLDTTPEISVLQGTPGLIDGDENTATGINIGGFTSGGETNWNMGVEVPANSPVDLVLLVTEDAVDPFLVNDFSFSVWTSTDNAFWTLVTSSASFTYEAAFRRFRIVVPQVNAQYIKVVNTASPPAAPAVLVTEMRVFDSASGPTAGESRFVTEDTTRSLNGNVNWRLHDRLTLGADLFVQDRRRRSDGSLTQDEDRVDAGLTAFWTATDITDVSLRANDRRSRDPIQGDEDFRLFNGLLDVHPLETLDLALNVTQTDREIDGTPSLSTRATQARAAAQLLETLQAELSVEQNTQDDTQNDRVIDRLIVAASLVAELTRSLDLTLAWRDEAADVSGSGAAGIPDPSEDSFEVLLLYQPSDQLTAEVDLTQRSTFAGSGLDQRLRVDWVPFPEGAIDFQFDVQRLVAGATDTTTDRYLLLTRWTFNPRAYLELNYSVQVPDQADRTDAVTVALNIRI